MPLLSIIMPTWNGSRYLRQQIESILNQSDPDFELLVVDDGSRDGTVGILDEFCSRDARVRRLVATGNEGQRLRLRQLLEAAQPSQYIAIADQDDIWHRERNARLLRGIGTNAVAFGRSQIIDGDGIDTGRSMLQTIGIDPYGFGALTSLLGGLLAAHAAIIRRSWLDLTVFSSPCHFDALIGLEAILSSGLIYVDDAIVYHRIHGNNQSNGVLIQPKARRFLSRYRFKLSTSFILTERVWLMITFDQLGKSQALQPNARHNFGSASQLCHQAWFGVSNRRLTRGLERELHRLLDNFATSPADLAAFKRRLRSVTRSQFSVTNIIEGASRYLKPRSIDDT